MVRNFLASAALASVALISSVASAQPTAPIESVLVIGHRQPQSILDRGGNVAVVDADEIQSAAVTHIQDLLVRVPGVNLQQGSGGEYLPSIRGAVLTGGGACGAFLMAQDGIPLRPQGFCNVNELIEAHSEAARSVEVIRGPGSALLGAGALQGVVNVRTIGDAGNRIAVEWGENDYYRLGVSWSGAGGEGEYGVAATLTDDGGWRKQTGTDQQKLTVWRRVEREMFSWQTGVTSIAHDQETGGYASSYRNRAIARQNANPEAYRELTATRLWSTLTQFDAGGGAWVLDTYARTSAMEFLQHFLPGTPLERNGQTSAGLRLTRMTSLAGGEIRTGLDSEFGAFWLQQTQAAASFGPFPTGRQYDYRVGQRDLALFAQWQRPLNEQLVLDLGVRLQQTAYRYDNLLADGNLAESGASCPGGCRYSRPADRSDRFDNLSMNAGLSYRITEQLRWFGNVTSGGRPPQTTEVYRLQGAQTLASLDSESVISVESGLRLQSGDLQLEAVLYAMEKRDVIYLDSSRSYLNGGSTEHAGLEFAANWQSSSGWVVRANASISRSEYSGESESSATPVSGNRVDTAPDFFGSAAVRRQLAEPVAAELEYIFTDGYYEDPENAHRYPGHELLNLAVFVDVARDLQLALRVHNLLDVAYAERADFTTFSGSRYFPGEPRSVRLQVSYDW